MPVAARGRRRGRSGPGTRDKFDGRQQGGRVSPGSLGASPRRPRRRSTVPRPRATRGGPTRRPGATSTARPRSARASAPSGRAASSAPARGARATSARPSPMSDQSCDGTSSRAGRRSPRASAARGPAPGRPSDAGPGPAARPARPSGLATPRIPADVAQQALKPDDPHRRQRPPGERARQDHDQNEMLPPPAGWQSESNALILIRTSRPDCASPAAPSRNPARVRPARPDSRIDEFGSVTACSRPQSRSRRVGLTCWPGPASRSTVGLLPDDDPSGGMASATGSDTGTSGGVTSLSITTSQRLWIKAGRRQVRPKTATHHRQDGRGQRVAQAWRVRAIP